MALADIRLVFNSSIKQSKSKAKKKNRCVFVPNMLSFRNKKESILHYKEILSHTFPRI